MSRTSLINSNYLNPFYKGSKKFLNNYGNYVANILDKVMFIVKASDDSRSGKKEK